MFANIFAVAVVALAALNPVLATIYTTSPVASTVGYGGQVLNISWADDGNAPTLATIGPCSVDLYVGSVSQQTKLQNLAASVDVSKTASISSTIDPTVGQSGLYYFVRFTSNGYKDPSNPSYYYEQFSARFTLQSMTGTFSNVILAEISATGSASATAAAVTTSNKAATTTVASASKSASASASVAANVKSSGAVERYAAPGLLAVVVAIGAVIAL